MTSELTKSSLLVSDQEIEEMISSLNSIDHPARNEVQHLSRSWIGAVMRQPDKTNLQKRRSFDYSKGKLWTYLLWRYESNITSKISANLKSDGLALMKKVSDNGSSLYWCGVDSQGSPVLWYLAFQDNFNKGSLEQRIEYASLIMQAGLDAMPIGIHDINFIICFDEFDYFSALKKPRLAPSFVKTFTTICPDRLKRAIFVTGRLGHVFLKIAKHIAPSSIMNKVHEVASREDAAKMLVSAQVIENECLPDFMGGKNAHDRERMENFPAMIKAIRSEMKKSALC